MSTANGVYLFRSCDAETPAEDCPNFDDVHVCSRDWLHDGVCRCECEHRWAYQDELPLSV